MIVSYSQFIRESSQEDRISLLFAEICRQSNDALEFLVTLIGDVRSSAIPNRYELKKLCQKWPKTSHNMDSSHGQEEVDLENFYLVKIDGKSFWANCGGDWQDPVYIKFTLGNGKFPLSCSLADQESLEKDKMKDHEIISLLKDKRKEMIKQQRKMTNNKLINPIVKGIKSGKRLIQCIADPFYDQWPQVPSVDDEMDKLGHENYALLEITPEKIVVGANNDSQDEHIVTIELINDKVNVTVKKGNYNDYDVPLPIILKNLGMPHYYLIEKTPDTSTETLTLSSIGMWIYYQHKSDQEQFSLYLGDPKEISDDKITIPYWSSQNYRVKEMPENHIKLKEFNKKSVELIHSVNMKIEDMDLIRL